MWTDEPHASLAAAAMVESSGTHIAYFFCCTSTEQCSLIAFDFFLLPRGCIRALTSGGDMRAALGLQFGTASTSNSPTPLLASPHSAATASNLAALESAHRAELDAQAASFGACLADVEKQRTAASEEAQHEQV